MASLFGELSRYRVGVAKTSTEDFFTQGLAWLLDRNRSLAASLFSELCDLQVDPDTLSIRSQRTYRANRIDLEITDRNHFIIVENKIDASLSRYVVQSQGDAAESCEIDQVRKYQDLALQQCGSTRHPFVLLISRTPIACDAPPPFRAVLWSEVYERLIRLRSLCEAPWQPLLTEFLGFMKELRMAFDGLTIDDAEVARRIDGVYAATHDLLRQGIARAGLSIKYKTDWQVYAGYYLQDLAALWVGIAYWGESFGRVVLGVHDVPASKRPDYQKAELVYDEATAMMCNILPFSSYQHLPGSAQVTAVSTFFADTMLKLRQGTKEA
jgi:hypothetical protein